MEFQSRQNYHYCNHYVHYATAKPQNQHSQKNLVMVNRNIMVKNHRTTMLKNLPWSK